MDLSKIINTSRKYEEFEETGCPYFFTDCGRNITDEVFHKHCLNDYKKCETFIYLSEK